MQYLSTDDKITIIQALSRLRRERIDYWRMTFECWRRTPTAAIADDLNFWAGRLRAVNDAQIAFAEIEASDV